MITIAATVAAILPQLHGWWAEGCGV